MCVKYGRSSHLEKVFTNTCSIAKSRKTLFRFARLMVTCLFSNVTTTYLEIFDISNVDMVSAEIYSSFTDSLSWKSTVEVARSTGFRFWINTGSY